MNTVVGALSSGVPLIGIPIMNEQPGQLLAEDAYKHNASRLKEAVASSGGVSRAADIVEQAIFTFMT
jgi:UDP:flavonoid glycosyltransferase YjiC (YdhE family)